MNGEQGSDFCPWCGATVPPGAVGCKECGRFVGAGRAEPPTRRPRWVWMALATAALVLIGGSVAVTLLVVGRGDGRRAPTMTAAATVATAGTDPDDLVAVASVGDATISLSDLQALYVAEPPVDDGFRDSLFRLIALEALKQALEADFGTAVDPAVVGGYLVESQAAMAEQGLAPAEFLGVANASQEMVRFDAELMALRDAALGQLLAAPETVEALFADPVTLTNVCVKHILVGTQGEAESVVARLEAGEDIAGVAAEVSLDTTADGGDLGCNAAGDYPAEFAEAATEAPLNEVTGPVETEFGFHVLVVSERTAPTRDEYLADPWAIASDEAIDGIWTEWLDGVLRAADAWVAPAYGTWTPIGVVAP